MNGTRQEIEDEIHNDIRLAFDLLKEKKSYRYEDIDLAKAYIVTNYWSVYAEWTSLLDMPVILVNTDASFGYSIGMHDPNAIEIAWIKYHREAMEIKPISGVI